MSKKQHKKYDDAFKAECVKAVADYDGNISQAAKALGLPMQTLHNWVKQAQAGKLPGVEDFNPVLVDLQEQVRALTKQLKRTELERDILKKATAYFAKEQQ